MHKKFHISAPGCSCESLQHTHGTTKELAVTCLKHNRFFLGLRCNFLKATIMSYLQVTVYYLPLRMVRSVHQCSAKPSQRTTPNGTFSERLSHDTGRTVFFLFFDGEINLIPALLSMFQRPGDGFFVALNGGSIHQTGNRESRHRVSAYSVERTLIGGFYFCAGLSCGVIGSDWDGAFTGCS